MFIQKRHWFYRANLSHVFTPRSFFIKSIPSKNMDAASINNLSLHIRISCQVDFRLLGTILPTLIYIWPFVFFFVDNNKIIATLRVFPSEAFYKKAVLKNFAIFLGKHLCWSLFLTNLQSFRTATLLKRDSNTSVFLWTLQNF